MRLRLLLGLVLAFFLASAPLFSQTPPPGTQVGPEEEAFRKPRPEVVEEKKPEIETKRVEELPPEAGVEVSFFVKEIAVEGKTYLKSSEVDETLAPYRNQTLTLRDLQRAARALTQKIRARGYVTTRVYVPPQKIEDGVARFKILEGKLGQVRVQGNKRFKERLIKRQMTTRPGEILRYARLERDLLRLNTHPDREVRAVLLPGEIPETTDVLLEVEEIFPLHAGYSFDNQGTRLTGRLRHGVTLAHSNLLGWDDIFQSRFLITDGGHFAGFSIDYLFPLTRATDLVFDFSAVETRIGGDFNPRKIRGEAATYSATFLHRLLDYGYLEGSLFAGFDFKEIETTENRIANSFDSLRVLRLGPQLVTRDPWGRTFLTNEFSWGFDTILGASDKVDSNSSRTEAGGQFFRSVLEVGRLQRLPKESFLLLRGTAHFTPDKLPSSEQMRVGGAETVRGYPEGDFLGERGFNFSAEIRVPPFFIPRSWKFTKSESLVRDLVQFLGFVDVARVETKGVPASQPSNRTLVGIGGGFRFNFGRRLLGRNISGRLDWGYPIGEAPLTEKRTSRFHFSLSFTF